MTDKFTLSVCNPKKGDTILWEGNNYINYPVATNLFISSEYLPLGPNKNFYHYMKERQRSCMTETEAVALRPGDKVWLDEKNWREVDGIIYDIATVIDPPTKLFNGRLVVNYEIRFGEASMVSSVYPEGCELYSRAEAVSGSTHKCYCPTWDVVNFGCKCGGI